MTAPDPILDAIDNAVRDYGLSDDAMRWTPEPPEEHAPPPVSPFPRIEEVEVRVKTSDGMEHTYVMPGAQGVSISMDWADPFQNPWAMCNLDRVEIPRLESFTLDVSYPVEVRETRRTPQ